MADMPELDKVRPEYLHTFCVVARLGNVSRAAEQLGSSQPAISRQLSQLQRAVGEVLYTRNAHGISLTRYGEALLPHACALSQTWHAAQTFLRDGDDPLVPALRFGMSYHLVPRYTNVLLRTSKHVLQKQDKVLGRDLELDMLEATSRDLTDAVEANELDAALIMAPKNTWHSSSYQRSFSDVEVCFIVKPDDVLAKQPYAPSHVLEGETLILPGSTSWLQAHVREHLQTAQVHPGSIVPLSSPNAVRSAVLQGLGIGISTRDFVASDVNAGLLCCVGIENADLVMRVVVVHQRLETLHPLHQQVLEQLLS